MPRARTIIDYNAIYHSKNYGDFIIVKELDGDNKGRRRVLIKFLASDPINPEHYNTCLLSDALRGEVKDIYLKVVCGVACIGNAISSVNGVLDRRYRVWTDMIHRCYDPKSACYNVYGGAGVSVYPYWLCYEFFLKDVVNLPGYIEWWNNPGVYTFDKDYLQFMVGRENKVYSPETCCFIPEHDNNQIRLQESKANTFSSYVGVTLASSTIFGNTYRARIRNSVDNINLGTYNNEIAAANIYDCYANYYNSVHGNNRYLINNAEYMTPAEIKSHFSGCGNFPGVPMYRLVDNK